MAGRHHLAQMSPILLLTIPVLFSSRQSPAVRDVIIVAADYTFTVPTPIRAGLTTFGFENRGQQRHEMSLARLKPGITVDSLLQINPGPARRALVDVNTGGILFAEPGQHTLDRLLVNLEAGRTYAVICNLRDAPDKPQHTSLGMFATFTVK